MHVWLTSSTLFGGCSELCVRSSRGYERDTEAFGNEMYQVNTAPNGGHTYMGVDEAAYQHLNIGAAAAEPASCETSRPPVPPERASCADTDGNQ